jgi:hypothetical protein
VGQNFARSRGVAYRLVLESVRSRNRLLLCDKTMCKVRCLSSQMDRLGPFLGLSIPYAITVSFVHVVLQGPQKARRNSTWSSAVRSRSATRHEAVRKWVMTIRPTRCKLTSISRFWSHMSSEIVMTCSSAGVSEAVTRGSSEIWMICSSVGVSGEAVIGESLEVLFSDSVVKRSSLSLTIPGPLDNRLLSAADVERIWLHRQFQRIKKNVE